ncbi:MAG TPA: glutamate racemase [Rhodocyclaceae bacterium]|nr:glutamate racemase [Rhodocyclaceae bacterium]
MIGVFDSGLGGLSVLSAIARASPDADLVYLADTAHLPYGSKSDEFICERVLAIGRHLAELGASTLVVACNTATAAALSALRRQHPGINVVGVEPGVKPAAAASRSGAIAVLATESTAGSERLSALIRTHAKAVSVRVEACPGWATRVETLQPIDSDPAFAAEVAAKILPLLDAGIDRLVLGCTHYSFLAPLIERMVAGRAELVDVADAVARQVLRQSSGAGSGRLALLATATPARLDAALPFLGLGWLASRIWGPAALAEI